jgi:hypothetical protein
MGWIRGANIEVTVVVLEPVPEIAQRTGKVEFHGENRRVRIQPFADRCSFTVFVHSLERATFRKIS